MRVVSDAEISDEELQQLLEEWKEGRSKNDIERVEWEDPYSHGKRATRLWRDRLDVETEAVHPLQLEVNRLRALLKAHGIDPDYQEQ